VLMSFDTTFFNDADIGTRDRKLAVR